VLTDETIEQFETLVDGLDSAEACDEAFAILRRHWDSINVTEPPQYAAGDIVEFDDNDGQTYYGTVVNVTKKSVKVDAVLVVDGIVGDLASPFNVAKTRVKRRLRMEE